MVKLLIDRSADLTIGNPDGNTVLNLAAWKGHKDVVKLLLNKAADPHALNNDGRNPLSYASWYGHRDVAKLLNQTPK